MKTKASGKIDKLIRIGFLIGFLLFIVGILQLLFLPSAIAINLRTLLPKVNNGAIFIVAGLGFIFGSLISIKNRYSLIEKETDRMIKKKKEKRKQPKWTKHY